MDLVQFTVHSTYPVQLTVHSTYPVQLTVHTLHYVPRLAKTQQGHVFKKNIIFFLKIGIFQSNQIKSFIRPQV